MPLSLSFLIGVCLPTFLLLQEIEYALHVRVIHPRPRSAPFSCLCRVLVLPIATWLLFFFSFRHAHRLTPFLVGTRLQVRNVRQCECRTDYCGPWHVHPQQAHADGICRSGLVPSLLLGRHTTIVQPALLTQLGADSMTFDDKSGARRIVSVRVWLLGPSRAAARDRRNADVNIMRWARTGPIQLRRWDGGTRGCFCSTATQVSSPCNIPK
mmetsp:Transcript_16096/g.44579  ORF Transcript_16096/g.44579 Transcript_16096/m.44579 type:complete len:211 (+) Transcript_16096:153-785(+)